jgi:glycine/D-amino acid oxidase-like deaminating enzyme
MAGHRTLTRRQFAGPFLVGLTAKGDRRIDGQFVNDGFPLGHKIRDHAAFASPKQTRKIPLVIVGGGCAGLSAAWRLQKKGFRDFVLLEMEPQAGGNARWGENEVSRYPWAAHYLPVPNKESALVRELCEELGLLEDGKWNERYLCFSEQERLYMNHRWQNGIEPEVGATPRDREQYQRFADRMREFRATGQFTKPIDIGAKPSPLDAMTFADWMKQERFDSELLLWYANYSTRDDYGALARDTSAWAGIHEFASREPEEKGPLTWPEGNGWIASRLIERVKPHIEAASPVYSIRKQGPGWRVLTEATEYLTEAVIFAAPSFTAQYVIEGAPPAAGFVYSPWLTANLTLDHWPRGESYSWDNVFYDSPSLGYVVATHMSLATHQPRTVWTYYWALADRSPQAWRKALLERDWNFWKEAILTDLEKAHPDIRSCVSHIDIMRLGHAMARPVPGFLGSEVRKRFVHGEPNLFYANSDLSGLSIFEEAQYRGVTAADRALTRLGQWHK